jgi:hypothetical protein
MVGCLVVYRTDTLKKIQMYNDSSTMALMQASVIARRAGVFSG